jgi:glutamyl-tRNA reductase
LKEFKIIAFTHKSAELSEIGKFHIEPDLQEEVLGKIKKEFNLEELMYLSTCNRVEFLFVTERDLTEYFFSDFISAVAPNITPLQIKSAYEKALVVEGEEALKHLFSVAASIDSLVVGEREIITQVRSAYEYASNKGLSGDSIRLITKKTIETAKKIYTHTNIASKPVSVVSLAYRRLKDLQVKPDARFLVIGAGQTNTSFAQYLKKHHLGNFTVFNRTLSNAEKLAEELNGKAFPLSELKNSKEPFDVIVTCTGSSEPILTKEIYESILNGCTDKKIIIDLAIPNDLSPEILNNFPITYIEVSSLKAIAEDNLKERRSEMVKCHAIIEEAIGEFRQIYKTRLIERAMKDVPLKVKEIKETALSTVFAKEVAALDFESKEILEKVLSYMEKKYISVPMKMAKEILINRQ